MSWRIEVETKDDEWNGNSLRFATKKEAEENAADLMSRWMLVKAWRVHKSDDPVNYRWTDDGLVRVIPNGPDEAEIERSQARIRHALGLTDEELLDGSQTEVPPPGNAK